MRYFAIYPFGAALHVFMNEFLDHRDSGTAILSHFYLLTGCAGSLWLDGYGLFFVMVYEVNECQGRVCCISLRVYLHLDWEMQL